jgi:hypothetical protein
MGPPLAFERAFVRRRLARATAAGYADFLVRLAADGLARNARVSFTAPVRSRDRRVFRRRRSGH